MMPDEYFLKARLYPAILTSPPLIILINSIFSSHIGDWVNNAEYASIFGKGILAAAIVYALVALNRFIAVELFEYAISKDTLHFPTTQLLMPNSAGLSSTMREAIAQKVQNQFSMPLPTSVSTTDENITRRQIADIVGRIRERTRSHKLLLQHNIEYGFVRNLIGGYLIAALSTRPIDMNMTIAVIRHISNRLWDKSSSRLTICFRAKEVSVMSP
jgi:hypothetical protein